MRVNRIFILLGNLGSGGAERVAANMANYFVSNGKEVAIAVYEDSNNFYELDERVKLIPLHLMFDSKSFVTKVTNTIKRLGIIRRVVLNYKPDIVVAFLTSPSVLGVLALLGSKIPFVASERSNPYVYPKEMSLRLMRDYSSYLADGYIFQTKRAMDYFPMSVRKRGTVIPNPVLVSNLPDIWRGSREKIIASMGRLSDQKDHET
ncbi:MAG TPA: glycosyltransferase, partial [Clostridia bacterium]